MTREIWLVNLKILVDSRQSWPNVPIFFYHIPTRKKQSFHFKIPNIVTLYVQGRYT